MELLLANKLFNTVLLFTIDATAIWLAFWVYLANRKDLSNRLFFLLTFSILSWVNAAYFFTFAKTLAEALFWARLGIAGGFLFFIAFYFFSSYLSREKEKINFLEKIVIVIGILLAYLTLFTNLIVSGAEFTDWGADIIFTLYGRMIFYGLVVVITILSVTKLFINYLRCSEREKLRIQYFLIGFSIFILMNVIFNVGLPVFRKTIRYWQLGNYSTIFLLFFTAFAIVKRKLFGIRVVLTQLLVALIAILLLVNFIVSQTTFEYAWKGALFLTFSFFGILLIKSILREIKQREKLEELTTKLGTAHIKLEGAYKKLQKLDKAKSEFISIASHQLRTPLTAIKGYVSMLLEGDFGKMPVKAKTSLGNVYKSNERLIDLVNDLLSVSRIEAGKVEVKLEKTDLAEIVKASMHEMKPQIEKKNLFLRFVKPTRPLPEIPVDREKIKEVILNILDNAIRYTKKGGISIKMTVINSELQIAISDTGEGMSREEIDKIFQSFSRGVAGARFFTEGAGLGLYIASKFVAMHKGKIYVRSPGKGKGSTFYIELPVR